MNDGTDLLMTFTPFSSAPYRRFPIRFDDDVTKRSLVYSSGSIESQIWRFPHLKVLPSVTVLHPTLLPPLRIHRGAAGHPPRRCFESFSLHDNCNTKVACTLIYFAAFRMASR